jgi:hypothetical protein
LFVQVINRGAQAVARGGARCASQVLDRGAKAVARGAAHCASQVLDRGDRAATRGAATLSQQKEINSADVQRKGLDIIGFMCAKAKVALAAMNLRRIRFV